MKKQIPNLFTLCNLFLGCLSIVFALQTENISIYTNEDFTSHFNIPERLSIAAILLFAAALVDFLDGFLARLLGASSELGKQLDSLSDVVSFGVAPGVILFQLLRLSWMQEEQGLQIGMIWLLPAFLVSIAAAYRLAVFNLDNSQSHGFKGLPTPAMGLLVASIPLILHQGNSLINININFLLINKWFLYGLIAFVSYLMVSSMPLLALKFRQFGFQANMAQYLLLGIGLVAALLLHWLAVPIIFIAYILLSLVFKSNSSI